MPLFVSSVCSAPSLCTLFDRPRPDTRAAVAKQQRCHSALGVSHRSVHSPSDLLGEQRRNMRLLERAVWGLGASGAPVEASSCLSGWGESQRGRAEG
jgi:hypothetical protein